MYGCGRVDIVLDSTIQDSIYSLLAGFLCDRIIYGILVLRSRFRSLGHYVVIDGVNGVVNEGGKAVVLEFDGISRVFSIDDSWQNHESIKLKKDERFVSGVLDESGYYLFLLFNQKEKQFVFIRYKTKPLPEKRTTFSYGNKLTFLVGQSSRFVFLSDQDREILVGVPNRNVIANNSRLQ